MSLNKGCGEHDKCPSEGGNGRRLALVAILVVALLQLLLLSTWGADPFKDDAYICLRYAQNLVSGNGLVFNPGERVEGFTTPLWVLLSSAILYLKLPGVLCLKLSGAFCFLGLLLSTWRAARAAGMPDLSCTTSTLVIACSSAIAYWSLSGLETVAFSWALMEGLSSFVRAARAGRRGSLSGAIWLGLATLLRPEGAAVFGILWLAVAIRPRWATFPPSGNRDSATSKWIAIRSILIFLIISVGYEVFRINYYHAWLPNTFYAKVESEPYVFLRGLKYLARSSTTTPLALLFIPVLATARAWRKPEVVLPLLVALFYLTYLCGVGGDYMVFGRFVIPLLAPLALAWGGTLSTATWKKEADAPKLRHLGPKWLLLLSATLLIGLTPHFSSPNSREPDQNLQRYRAAGAWIKANVPPENLVATPAIGAIGYLGQARVLDTLGIVDPYLARYRDPKIDEIRAPAGHARGDGAYVLERAPDIVFLANVWLRPVPLEPAQVAANTYLLSLTDRLLLGLPEFLKRYEILSYELDDGNFLGMAIRRDSVLHPDHPGYRGPRRILRSRRNQ